MSRPSIDALESRQLLSAVSFNVDTTASALTITSTAKVSHASTFSLKPQADGLDTASLKGTLVADFSSKGVRFAGGSEIDVVDHSGKYSPGDKPAAFAVSGKVKKYGIKLASASAAVRGLSFDLTNSSRKKPAGNHKFPIRNGEAEILDGDADYKLDSRFGDADGSKSLEGMKSAIENAFAKVTGASGSRTITVPIDIVYTRKFSGDYSGTFRLKGQIVAHEAASASSVGAPQTVPAAPVSTTKHKHQQAPDPVFIGPI